jgi:hypothetical protein
MPRLYRVKFRGKNIRVKAPNGLGERELIKWILRHFSKQEIRKQEKLEMEREKRRKRRIRRKKRPAAQQQAPPATEFERNIEGRVPSTPMELFQINDMAKDQAEREGKAALLKNKELARENEVLAMIQDQRC